LSSDKRRIILDEKAYKWLKDIVDQVVDTVEQAPSKYSFSLDPVRSVQQSLEGAEISSQKIAAKKSPTKTKTVSNDKDQKHIDKILKAKRPFTISQMSDRLGVSPAKTRDLVNKLVSRQSIVVTGQRSGGPGRSPTMYKVN